MSIITCFLFLSPRSRSNHYVQPHFHRLSLALQTCLNMRPVGLIIYHIFHRPVLRKGRKITQAAHLNKNRNSQLGTQFVYKVDSSLRFYLFLQLIAPRVMFSVCLHHSVFDIFVNKSAQSTLCQTCSLGLSLARANTYLFLEANMKLFDFFELAAHSISVWFTESKGHNRRALSASFMRVFLWFPTSLLSTEVAK